MAIAYSSAGAGVSTETNGAALNPAHPAVVNANDILICHVLHEGTTNVPGTPAGYTLLFGPASIGTTTVVSRHWAFGKIATGTEDATTVSLGTVGGTNQRGARIYSFTGYVSGTITQVVRAFSSTAHDTDPQMPTVTTTVAGALAVALVTQNDNNAIAAATGATGGTWAEPVAEYAPALTPGMVLQLETATPTANPGTITGGAVVATNDPSGVIGFEIRPNPVSSTTSTGEVKLEPKPVPINDRGHNIVVRARVTTAVTATVRAQLFEGATARSAEYETPELTTSLRDYQLPLTFAEADAITAYTDLRIRFRGFSATGAAATVEIADLALTTVSPWPVPQIEMGPVSAS